MTTSAYRVDLVLNRAKVAAELTINLDATLSGYVPKSQLAAKEAAQLQTRASTMRETIEQHLKEPDIIRDTNAYMTLLMLAQKPDADLIHHVEKARRVNSTITGELNACNLWAEHVSREVNHAFTKRAFTPPQTTEDNLAQLTGPSLTWHALQGGN